MPKPLNAVLAQIAAGSPPAAILVGRPSDYLSEQAFREIRDAIVAARQGIAIESFEAGTELAAILDSYRTGSLFGSGRLLIVPEVNAFVSAKELSSLLDKAVADWKSAKTDKKRASSSAKLLHVLGLAGCDLEMTDRQIAGALGVAAEGPIADLLADKFSRDVPDLRFAVSEAERLITLAGTGGQVTAEMIEREVASVEGGARYELGSLFTEGKIVEAIAKLRDLVAQARREDAKAPVEIHYGKFLFPLADELRQLIGVVSYARTNRIDLRASMPYNRFKDTVADRLGEYLKANGIVRQTPHPFPLHKKWAAARTHSGAHLF